ncbi:tyrosine-type recombinase/integrase [Delftia acidovorans]|uniref:tyrosine-type recombinase/integrase n=1 Tax=Delftia acidovorans TaxID=80866 RepID=UPI0012FD914E
MWNFAREQGLTKASNPCAGMRGFWEDGRDVVVGDDLMARLLEKAAVSLRFAVHLALLTGQRPADVLRMSTDHIAGGMLHVRQGKTAKLRIEVTGALQELLAEIQAYKVQVKADTAQLLVNEAGQPLTKNMLRDRFDAARDAAGIPKAQFQFRDLRATATTTVDDDGGIRHAQALLGHTTEGMTAQCIRHKVGKKVKPVRCIAEHAQNCGTRAANLCSVLLLLR